MLSRHLIIFWLYGVFLEDFSQCIPHGENGQASSEESDNVFFTSGRLLLSVDRLCAHPTCPPSSDRQHFSAWVPVLLFKLCPQLAEISFPSTTGSSA